MITAESTARFQGNPVARGPRSRIIGYCAVHRGVCHRDLKLENLLLAAPGDIGRIKIADFGLAKKASRDDFLLDTICGTPQYVAPEVIAVSMKLSTSNMA